MGCIPTNSWDKHFLRAKYFLSALGVTEKPHCSALESILKTSLSAISEIVGLVSAAAGGILATPIVNYAFDTIEGEIKIDLRNLEKYAGEIGGHWDKLEWNDRHHIIRMGFADIAHAYSQFLEQLEKGALPKPILNWMYFIKGMQEAEENGTLTHWHLTPTNVEFSIHDVHRHKYDVGSKYHKDFSKYSVEALEIIRGLKARDFKKKSDGTPDWSQEKSGLEKALPFAAAAGLLFAFKR